MAFLTTLALSLIFVTAAAANDEPVVIIPLDQIWALDMPGTRDIGEYDFSHDDPRIKGRDRLSEGRGITGQLRSKLWLKPLKQDALPAFILRQNGPKRLLQMLRVAGSTVNDKDSITRARFEQLSDRFLTPRNGFRFTLCFFSHPSVYRVELVKIERRGLEIDIQYRFVPRYSAENSAHWAFIPLGELPAGDYHVNISKLPMAQEFLDAGFQPVSEETAKRIVCQPLDFHVRYAPMEEEVVFENDNSDGETVTIPLEEIAGLGRKGLNSLEPDLIIYRDTPEKIARYSTPEGLEEMKRLSVKSLVLQIKRAFYEMSRKEKSKAGKGFAISGRDRDALPELYRVAVKGESPRKRFTEDEEISLVFFTNPATPVVRIERVERARTTVNIFYSIYPQGRQMQRSKLLLIPCGKLPIGKYQVNINRLPANEAGGFAGNSPPVQEGLENRIVCKSFSFAVSDALNQSPSDADGNSTAQ